MKKILSIIFIVPLFCVSCVCSKQPTATELYSDVEAQIRSKEWISFDVELSSICMKKKYSRGKANVIIHNEPDYVAVLHPNYAVKINSDSVLYIHSYYNEIACYKKAYGKYDYYGMLCGDEIGNYLSLLSVYSPVLCMHTWTSIKDSVMTPKKKGKYLCIDGKTIIKECTEKECQLKEIPVSLYIDTLKKTLDLAVSRTGLFEYNVQEISNISYDNQQLVIDSLFDIYSPGYRQYSLQNDDSGYVYSRSYYNNTLITEKVLHFPLVNVNTEDTTSISAINGWILLCMFEMPDLDLPLLFNQTLRIDSSITALFISPYSNNILFTRKESEKYGLSDVTFCAKGFSRLLSTQYKYYLISPEKNIVFKTNWISHNEIKNINHIINDENEKIKVISKN